MIGRSKLQAVTAQGPLRATTKMRQHDKNCSQPKCGHPSSDEIEATKGEAGETTDCQYLAQLSSGVAHGNQWAEAGADTSNTD